METKQTAVDILFNEIRDSKAFLPDNLFSYLEDVYKKSKQIEKEQIGYTEEQVYQFWKAGQKYWETSGKSITFEELIEQYQNKTYNIIK
jgi:hypothetical protein